jgi:hypothetical protein
MRLQIVLTCINEEIIILFPVDAGTKTAAVPFISKTNTFPGFLL